MLTVIDDPSNLLQAIRRANAKFIAIDGRDGSGKTYLATTLSNLTPSLHLTEDDYRTTDAVIGIFQLKNPDQLASAIHTAVANGKLVIFDCVLMRWVLEKIGIKPDLNIYVKKLASNGLWGDEDEVGCERPRDEVVQQAIEWHGTPFRIQMIDYHYKYRPHEIADIIFTRVEE